MRMTGTGLPCRLLDTLLLSPGKNGIGHQEELERLNHISKKYNARNKKWASYKSSFGGRESSSIACPKA